MDLISQIVERAKANKQRIVLPEGTEERTLKAADQLLAVARMVDNNVASWLVSNDVVEKADLVKRNKKLIEDINRKLSRKMRMDREQSHALYVFKRAEKYFNETCLQNNKR